MLASCTPSIMHALEPRSLSPMMLYVRVSTIHTAVELVFAYSLFRSYGLRSRRASSAPLQNRIHVEPIGKAEIEVNGSVFTDVVSQGNDSLVIWNPWQGAASISDMARFGNNTCCA